MTEKPSKGRISIAAVLGLLLILVLAVINFRLGASPALRLLRRQTGFRQMTEEIASAYTSDAFKPKDSCLTLNGLFARVTGRRVYNDVTLMNNGMLTHGSASRQDMTEDAEKIISLASFARDRVGTPFLLVAPPYKVPLEGGDDLLPAGKHNYRNENYLELLQRMSDAGFATLNLKQYLSANLALVEKYMYRTDHHWNNDGAIEAFGYIMNSLENIMGTKLDKTYTDLSLWERHELKDFWIGSHGKRVGPLFAGTDSCIWYTPKFDTSLSYAYNRKEKQFGFKKGDYSIYVFDQKFTRGDWYNVNCSQVYMDKLFPLVIHRNLNAPNKKKIMMIGDSYCRGMQTFLATEFSEVHMIDTRYVSGFTTAQYVAWTKPDALILLTSSLHDGFIIDFGADEEAAWLDAHPGRTVLLGDQKFILQPDDSKTNAVELPVSLQPGQTYHLSFTGVQTAGEPADCVTAALYEKNKKKTLWTAMFDIEYCNETGAYTCGFNVPDDNPEGDYVILLCPGIWKKTPETEAVFSGVTLEQEV